MPWLSTPRILPTESVRGKGSDQASACVWRAADDLHRLLAVADIDSQHLELVGIRVLLRRKDPGDDKRLQRRLVVDMLDLEADGGEALYDLVERGIGFEMVLQPGKGEFHCSVSSGLGTLLLRWRGRPSGMCT